MLLYQSNNTNTQTKIHTFLAYNKTTNNIYTFANVCGPNVGNIAADCPFGDKSISENKRGQLQKLFIYRSWFTQDTLLISGAHFISVNIHTVVDFSSTL